MQGLGFFWNTVYIVNNYTPFILWCLLFVLCMG